MVLVLLLVVIGAAVGASVGLPRIAAAHRRRPTASSVRRGLVTIALAPWVTVACLIGTFVGPQHAWGGWSLVVAAVPAGVAVLVGGARTVGVTERGAQYLIWLTCAAIGLAALGTAAVVPVAVEFETPVATGVMTAAGACIAAAEVVFARRLTRTPDLA